MKYNPYKFKAIHWHLLWQPLVAVIYIAFVLILLSISGSNNLIWAIGAGALSSSCYIVFVTPKSVTAEPRRIIGGYIVGIMCGLVVHIILVSLRQHWMAQSNQTHINDHIFWASAAITVGLAMILMIILNAEHPPAVGVSLVLVLDIQHYDIIVLILAAAFVLAILKGLLNPWMINLAIHYDKDKQ